MGVVKRDNGWDAFYCITKDGKKLRGHKRGFPTKKEALAWIESQKATVTAEKPITLNELWLEYEKDQSVRLKANTMANKRFQIQKILSRFGEMQLRYPLSWDSRESNIKGRLNGKQKNS